MTRTQIYLTESLQKDLRYLAKMKGVSVSELIRQYLDEKITIEKPKKISFFQALENVRKQCKIKVRKSDKYLSRDIDKILYG